MKKLKLPLLVFAASLVAGCPHNEYTLTLTPRGDVIERQLVFRRVDRADTNKPPTYEPFPSNELATIERAYRGGTVTAHGQRKLATAEFRGTMPDDIGGAGTYTNLVSSMGRAGFYVERFRGEPDFAGRADERFRAADQLVDLALGWSRAEFGREDHYPDLQRFLDVDVRRDLKNLSLYFWMGEVTAAYKSGADEEFAARFVQFLVERRYLTAADVSALFLSVQSKGDETWVRLLERLIADKLQLPATNPPPSLAVLSDSQALEASWERFLATSDQYRAMLSQSEKDRVRDPDVKKPEPSDVTGVYLEQLLQVDGGGENDRLTVELVLSAPPLHTNGEWTESAKKVRWEARLEPRGKAVQLPGFCYATWAVPDEQFQQDHLGRVALRGDELLQYCLWRAGLPARSAGEWEKFLRGLRPAADLDQKLGSFRFSDESRPTTTNGVAAPVSSTFVRELLKTSIGEASPSGAH